MTDVLDGLLALAQDLAGQAATLLLEGLAGPRSDVRTKSSATDMVTEMDRASERLIVEGIGRARPGDEILSEEGSSATGTTGVRWVVDPLDGTTNYLYGHPGFAVSIAVEIEGRPVVGVVHDPVHGEVFTGVRGQGAARNGVPIRVSALADPATALLATGFSYDAGLRGEQAAALVWLLPRVRDIRRVGAASVDLCWAACGRVDAYFERDLSPWDVAAGLVIAEEAGAAVGAIEGGPPGPASVLAAPPLLFGPLQVLLQQAHA